MDEKITDGYGDEKMALIVLSDALPASLYFPGHEGKVYNGDDNDPPGDAPSPQA